MSMFAVPAIRRAGRFIDEASAQAFHEQSQLLPFSAMLRMLPLIS